MAMRFHIHAPLQWLPAAAAAFTLAATVTTGCRFAPKDEPGDTVAAAVFMPIDTSAPSYKARHQKTLAAKRDSADIFYIGEGSDRKILRLISYPSRKDTVEMKRQRHIEIYGSTEAGHLVKVIREVTAQGDTVVTQLMELDPKK